MDMMVQGRSMVSTDPSPQDDYFADQDVIARWADECCEFDRSFGDTSGRLFGAWRAFAVANVFSRRASGMLMPPNFDFQA